MHTIAVTVDGHRTALPFAGVTAVDVRDYARAVGRPLRDALRVRADLDIDEVAGVVWLAMRRENPQLSYEAVAAQITLDAVAALEIIEEG